jgi:uncharacterized Fe-S cluster protein YjdI
MMLTTVRDTGGGDVAITDSLNFEDLTALGDCIKGAVNGFKQQEDPVWISTP